MQPFKIRKLANGFYPNAIPSVLLQGPAKVSVALIQKKIGGLWVGGSVELTEQGVTFKANALNEAFHVGLEQVSIPSSEIISVRREFGWVTGIVVISHSDGEFRFRCFGAKRVADEHNKKRSML